MLRQEANRKLIEILKAEVESQPTIRFGQLLRNIGVIIDTIPEGYNTPIWQNHFYEEPDDMLARVKNTLKQRVR